MKKRLLSSARMEPDRAMSIRDFAYAKGITEAKVINLIKCRKIDSIELNGINYVYLSLITTDWNESREKEIEPNIQTYNIS